MELTEIIQSLSKKKLTEDEVYNIETKVREACTVNVSFYPRAKVVLRAKYDLTDLQFDLVIWAATKEYIFKALIVAEFGEGRHCDSSVKELKRKGYIEVTYKPRFGVVDPSPTFYGVTQKAKMVYSELLRMLHPDFKVKHAKSFYLRDPLWVGQHVKRFDRVYYKRLIEKQKVKFVK